VRTGGTQSIRDAILDRWFAPGFRDAHPDWFHQASAVFSATQAAGYIGCCEALAKADLRADVSRVAVPVLVIGGSLDQATPPDQAEWLHSAVAGSELTILDGAAHLSNLDHATEFTERVARFLGERQP
jgi:pimeloyl-ACP methyl ester carboxylesterase